MISFISLFGITNVVMSDPKTSFWKPISVADAAAVNSKGIKTLLGTGLSTFCIKVNQFLVIAI